MKELTGICHSHHSETVVFQSTVKKRKDSINQTIFHLKVYYHLTTILQAACSVISNSTIYCLVPAL